MKRKQRGQDIKYPLNLMHNRETDQINYSKDVCVWGGGKVQQRKDKDYKCSTVFSMCGRRVVRTDCECLMQIKPD